jgi:hypothetical protein
MLMTLRLAAWRDLDPGCMERRLGNIGRWEKVLDGHGAGIS